MKDRRSSYHFGIVDSASVALFVGTTSLFWAFADEYRQLSGLHPYLTAFVVFAILSSFGEGLSLRIATGSWLPTFLVRRAALWGAIGVWISAVFPFEVGGVQSIAAAGLWPSLPLAFSISLWANLFSGFAFFMMLTHFWLEIVITRRPIPPWLLFAEPSFIPWARTVSLSLVLFWLPAHTITFLLPAAWRSLFAAYLGIALGVILTSAKQFKSADIEGTDVLAPTPPARRR